ncbi:DNA methyltransferase [Zobellella denitrificans]|jgi:hypothetical protein|uniref:DNA methyltransferase n=1 Tax=Zobellella denitrificans TaxID=347534 RepID=A0A291HL46_9GAMM|nr:DNA methyltransferase [Zobellella denitrificans]ATG72887.1 DNA methyltransferase [Zobellella denitrificans]
MSSTNGNVLPRESYPTPHSVVSALLSRLEVRQGDHFLEPCRGTDAIWNQIPLPETQKHWAEIEMGRDYLKTAFQHKMDIIITNPPFSLAEPFIEKSLSELSDDGTMAYLQRVNFLGSKRRVPFWKNVGFPDKSPIIVPRPRFVGGNSDSCEYAWFIWDRGNRFNIDKGLSHLLCD